MVQTKSTATQRGIASFGPKLFLLEKVHSVEGRTESKKAAMFNVLLEMLEQHDIDVSAKLNKYTRRDSNPQPSVPKTDALSS